MGEVPAQLPDELNQDLDVLHGDDVGILAGSHGGQADRCPARRIDRRAVGPGAGIRQRFRVRMKSQCPADIALLLHLSIPLRQKRTDVIRRGASLRIVPAVAVPDMIRRNINLCGAVDTLDCVVGDPEGRRISGHMFRHRRRTHVVPEIVVHFIADDPARGKAIRGLCQCRQELLIQADSLGGIRVPRDKIRRRFPLDA